MSDNDNVTLPMVPALPPMFEEMGAAADVERPEKKRSAPADNEDEAAKPQKKKRPTAKQVASKILAENSNTDPKGLYTATADAKWLRNLFAFHLFCSRNGITANPSTKSPLEDEKRLATRELDTCNRKIIELLNKLPNPYVVNNQFVGSVSNEIDVASSVDIIVNN